MALDPGWGVVLGAVVGASAVLIGQQLTNMSGERVAYRARQHAVLDDLSRKLADVREQAGEAQQSAGAHDAGLVVSLRGLVTISPSIHDDELRNRVNTFIDAAWGFRVKPVNWTLIQVPYDAVRDRLTEVYKKLG